MTQVIDGVVSNFYYLYDTERKQLIISDNQQDLDRHTEQTKIESQVEKNKTPEQVAKMMESIQQNIETLSKEQQQRSQQQLKKLDEQLQQAAKDGKTAEELDKLRQQ
jgi:uncharacterized protein YhbP (UPF0306 family)